MFTRHSTPSKLKPENIALELVEFCNFAGLESDIIFVGHKTRNDFLMICFVFFFWSTNDVITYYLQYFFKEQSIKFMRSGGLVILQREHSIFYLIFCDRFAQISLLFSDKPSSASSLRQFLIHTLFLVCSH